MKVLCNREKLREGLAVANGVIPAKSTKPVLENVCLVATDAGLELLGTDLEVSLRYTIADVEVSEPGTAVIPARVALDFIRDLSSETVTMELGDDENITIQGGDDSCELVTVDPDEYPVISRFDVEGSFSVQGGNLTRLVGQTAFAAAREGGRYAMHGILIEVDQGRLRMVATDGRRLAVTSTVLDCPEDSAHRAIVPTKGLQMFSRILGDPMARVRIGFEETQFCLKTDQAEIFARLIDGEFPKYSQVVPDEGSCKVDADAALLVNKLRLTSTVTSADARAVKLQFTEDHIEILARATGRGRATGQMEASYQGDDVDIAFNPDFLIDGLKQCESDRVHLEFNDRTSPGKFSLGQDYTYVVMPITIDT